MSSISMLSMEDQIALENQLTAFLQKSESNWSAIVDKGGNLFVQSGETGDLDLSILCALAAGSFAATHELAKRLGETDFSALYQEGQNMSILMMALEHECLLIVVFSQQTNIGLVRFYAHQLTQVVNEGLRTAYHSSLSAEPLQVEGDFDSSDRSVFS
ncbi:MAG: hypothetical protein OHK005_06510 [Candidatus Methylacidiphilales bacterium]